MGKSVKKGEAVIAFPLFWVRPTRYAHCGESPLGAAMMRNPRPEEQLRGGNEPWERKFEGKSRLYEQKLDLMEGVLHGAVLQDCTSDLLTQPRVPEENSST